MKIFSGNPWKDFVIILFLMFGIGPVIISMFGAKLGLVKKITITEEMLTNAEGICFLMYEGGQRRGCFAKVGTYPEEITQLPDCTTNNQFTSDLSKLMFAINLINLSAENAAKISEQDIRIGSIILTGVKNKCNALTYLERALKQ